MIEISIDSNVFVEQKLQHFSEKFQNSNKFQTDAINPLNTTGHW